MEGQKTQPTIKKIFMLIRINSDNFNHKKNTYCVNPQMLLAKGLIIIIIFSK